MIHKPKIEDRGCKNPRENDGIKNKKIFCENVVIKINKGKNFT